VNGFLLWIAQGFGIGRIRVAPGTWGSLVGLLWFALLLVPRSGAWFLGGTIAGVAVSVWLCGNAEKTLNRKDPPSVVLDEIIAIPICFSGWLGIVWLKSSSWPAPGFFFSAETWLATAAVFAAFRFFDVLKPWPVHQSQSLPGGWGVTVDDVLAAVYVNVALLAVYAGKTLLGK
jgi:phosphatidylglycerophosphatase A